MKKLIRLVLALALLLLPVGALAVDYSIPQYSMDVALTADGSARVVEDMTYSFNGSYNGILSSIDVGDLEDLVDLKLYVDGSTLLRQVDEMQMEPYTYTARRSGDLLNIQAYAPGSGGERYFRFEYRMTGLAQRYQDAARLNYKLIPIENDETLQNAVVHVSFPGAAPEHYFAHGAMGEGDITLEADGSLTLGPADVRPGQYVELDALFSAESLSQAPVINQAIVESALETERKLAEEKAVEAASRVRMRYGLMGLLAAFFIGAAVVLRGKLARYGVKKDIKSADDLTQLEGLDAAIAQRLVQRRVDECGFSATLLELVQRGALAMSNETHPVTGEKTAKFTVVNRGADMTGQQRTLFDWLFGSREFLLIEELNAGKDRARAQAFASGYNSWIQTVRMDSVEQGLFFGKRAAFWFGVVMLTIAGVLLSASAMILGLPWIGLAGLILTVVMVVGFSRVRYITDPGEAKFAAVRGYCEKYGEKISDIPPEALKYIPILVALGYVEPLAKYLEQRANEPGYGYGNMLPIWWYAGWYYDVGYARRSFHDVQRHNASVASQSSGSSGGGGFSGSSGGGGGGGGHGAW